VLEQERRFPSEWQLENMLVVAAAMTASALVREESRGVHFRTDFPDSKPALAQKHTSFENGTTKM